MFPCKRNSKQGKPLLLQEVTVNIKSTASQSSYFTSVSAAEMAEQKPRKLTKKERAIQYWKTQNFVHNAVQIVSKAAELCAENIDELDDHIDLFNKMLHSIFFLGNIRDAQFDPNLIFDDEEIFEEIRELFRGPFVKYSTEVAVRTPFSYFLDLVVSTSTNQEEMKTVLSDTLRQCKGSGIKCTLISSVICICEVSGKRYYGGSLSCPGDVEREIMTAVSCFQVWDNYVTSAVLSVFPEDRTEPVSMTLPSSVECRAYAIENLSEVKAPCLRCHELYSLPNHSDNKNKPGNCAETEAISNLLTNEAEVKNGTRMNGPVLEEEYIQERMMHHFNSKINQGNYSINRIYESE
ncbi:hypothetical protein AMEX_G4986 [Astyanax mexicanus]|uniref:Uncharacterized protein n=1 Tax=Astyanax mexicanus TaxID=7994 RepID=A0A8T2M540_ASTMX|nr:hypothetical protein AMEX_G4986 [Astyanax mexicanus]